MIKRSELKNLENSNVKYFYSEKEAQSYQRTLGNVISKIDQWQLKLDDATTEELEERKIYVERLISERPDANEAQKDLLRQVYYTSDDIYSVTIVSTKTPKEFYHNSLGVLVYDDEINGASVAIEGVHFRKTEETEA